MLKQLKQTKVAFEDKLVRIALFGCSLPTFIALIFLFNSELSIYLKWLLTFLMATFIFFTILAIRQSVIFQLRTSTNLVEAMTSGDYSLRANNKDIKGALADFNQLLNALGNRLSEQSLITREKQILLSKITDQIDVAVVAVNGDNHITLMNPAAERFFHQRFEDRQGWPISSLGLQNVIDATKQEGLSKVSEFEIGENKRKVFVRTDTFFELGKPNYMIFVTDIQQILRDEERLAWQRLLRVLSHEINNSLTPIASIAETLTQLVNNRQHEDDLDAGLQHSMQEGLSVISERAHALNHFIQDYRQLTRLPLPNKTQFSAIGFLHQIGQLFESTEIELPDEDFPLYGDQEQLQQVFINLLKNAHEANLANQQDTSRVTVSWGFTPVGVNINIVDQGGGIHNPENLFVPFYTTKKQGSGIGLILSRQIALNHGGDLTLQNAESQGAKATLTLPLLTENRH